MYVYIFVEIVTTFIHIIFKNILEICNYFNKDIHVHNTKMHKKKGIQLVGTPFAKL